MSRVPFLALEVGSLLRESNCYISTVNDCFVLVKVRHSSEDVKTFERREKFFDDLS
jgi:hypothetical protein